MNVEASAGGGKQSKKAKLAEGRAKQAAHVDESVDRVIAEFVDAGKISSSEIDDGVRRLLSRRSARVANLALTEYRRRAELSESNVVVCGRRARSNAQAKRVQTHVSSLDASRRYASLVGREKFENPSAYFAAERTLGFLWFLHFKRRASAVQRCKDQQERRS